MSDIYKYFNVYLQTLTVNFYWIIFIFRDYRYYDRDMIHPSELAVDFIFEKFAEQFFAKETLQLNADIAQVKANLEHNSRFTETESYQMHLSKTLQLIRTITSKHPEIDAPFAEELDFIARTLKSS